MTNSNNSFLKTLKKKLIKAIKIIQRQDNAQHWRLGAAPHDFRYGRYRGGHQG